MIRKTLLAFAALAMATAPAMAATTAPTHAVTRAVPAKSAVPAKKLAVAKRAAPATPAKPVRTASAAKAPSRSGLVTTRLANGKTVTYDCHLAGNKAKTVCKGKG